MNREALGASLFIFGSGTRIQNLRTAGVSGLINESVPCLFIFAVQK